MGKEQNKPAFSAWDIALIVVAGALANILGLLAIPGPVNIKFTMTMVPVFLVAYARGWKTGFLAGCLGGIMLGLNYGFIWYALILTGVMGFVSGFLVEKFALFRKYPMWAGIIGALAEVPGDMAVTIMFGDPMFMVIGFALKDFTQDAIAAFVAVLILKNKRVQKGLRSMVRF